MARGRTRAVLIVEVEHDDANVQHPEHDEDLGICLAEHLFDTFNDDGSLVRVAFLIPGTEDREDAETIRGRWRDCGPC